MLSVDVGSMKLARILAGVAPNGLCGALLFWHHPNVACFHLQSELSRRRPTARLGGSHLQYRYTNVYYLQYRYTSV